MDGEVFHEWLYDIEKDVVRRTTEYIQVWNEVTGETTRSPALQGADLPKVLRPGADSEVVSFLLPNGQHGRAIAKRIWPVHEVESSSVASGDEAAAREGVSAATTSMPHIMVVALDTEDVEEELFKLMGTLLLGLVFSLFVSIVTIRLIIALSFRPLDQLEEVIQCIDVNNPKDVFELPQDLPLELRGAVTRYRDLLSRISHVRERERERDIY